MIYRQLSFLGENDQILWSSSNDNEVEEEPIEDHEGQTYMDLGATDPLFDTSQ